MVKINKREILQRILIIPKTQKRMFWAREMKMLNTLMDEFSDQSFWAKFIFEKKYDSLAYFISPYGKKYLRRKFNEYNYKPPKHKPIKLGKKIGKDRIAERKNKTIKDFYDE